MGARSTLARLSAISLVLVVLSVLVAPPVSAAPVLRQGARGPDVVELQSRLADLDYAVGPVDGRFGPLTRTALISFQKANGLTRDGIVGPKTWGALGAVSPAPPVSTASPASTAPPASSSPPASSAPLLRQGARGRSVVDLQSKLANLDYDVGAVDGRFGPAPGTRSSPSRRSTA